MSFVSGHWTKLPSTPPEPTVDEEDTDSLSASAVRTTFHHELDCLSRALEGL